MKIAASNFTINELIKYPTRAGEGAALIIKKSFHKGFFREPYIQLVPLVLVTV